MCGITGFFNHERIQDPKKIIREMTTAIKHRGPDALSEKIETNISLGHTRLSIQDLSPSGSQPMTSNSGRYVITYNGEIYNFLKLKKVLLNNGITNFDGHSDTEVLLKYIELFGLLKALEDIRGMFAFALWDKNENKISLVRDRMGQKPLYYFMENDHFAFASELKSLQAYPFIKKEISPIALQLYFKYNCIPHPYSIYENTYKLSPGTVLEVDLSSFKTKSFQYWDLQKVATEGINRLESDYQVVLKTLEQKLTSVIQEQMISDVPYGAFLSGGIDSSLIVSIMQSLSTGPINTFTIGFNEKGFDEAIYAKKIANQIGTNHHELYLDQRDCLNLIPELSKIYSEPFSDSSQIPTYLVSKMARRDVTVCLSGDGGDELFAGYNRHFWIEHIWKLKNRVTPLGIGLLNTFVDFVSPQKLNELGNHIFGGKIRSMGDSLSKLSRSMSQDSKDQIYNLLVSHFPINSELILNKQLKIDPLHINGLDFSLDDNRFLLQDQLTYLPNDILTKVDQAAMANSLETRIPFLDRQIVEYAWRIPLTEKCRNKRGKLPLKDLLYKRVSRDLLERPKAGFGIPLDTWLRKDLREWAEDLISQKNIDSSGLLDYEIVRTMWCEHVSGRANWQYHLWDIMMFQSWYLQNR